MKKTLVVSVNYGFGGSVMTVTNANSSSESEKFTLQNQKREWKIVHHWLSFPTQIDQCWGTAVGRCSGNARDAIGTCSGRDLGVLQAFFGGGVTSLCTCSGLLSRDLVPSISDRVLTETELSVARREAHYPDVL